MKSLSKKEHHAYLFNDLKILISVSPRLDVNSYFNCWRIGEYVSQQTSLGQLFASGGFVLAGISQSRELDTEKLGSIRN